MHPEVQPVEELLAQQVCTRSRLPTTATCSWRSRTSRTAAARSGPSCVDPAHDRSGRPREATCFGTRLNSVAMPSSSPPRWCGQQAAKMSYVRRPRSRASVPSQAAATCAPDTSSSSGACQPPCGKPPGSSSGPPGACPTRSRVANSSTWIRPTGAPGNVVAGRGGDPATWPDSSLTPRRPRPGPLSRPPSRGARARSAARSPRSRRGCCRRGPTAAGTRRPRRTRRR